MPAIFALLYLLLIAGLGTGWVMNIVALVAADAIHGLEAARIIGVVMPPIGALMGWFF